MDSTGAVYAQVPEGDRILLMAALHRLHDAKLGRFIGVVAFNETQHRFALVDRWGKSDQMPKWAEGPDLSRATELVALSKEVGDVVAFYGVEGGCDVFGTWRAGKLIRTLVWMDEEWVVAQGEPQPWEKALFAREYLEKALHDIDAAGRDATDVIAAFAQGVIKQGAHWPPSGRAPVHIREALVAPPFGVQPWPRRVDALRNHIIGQP